MAPKTSSQSASSGAQKKAAALTAARIQLPRPAYRSRIVFKKVSGVEEGGGEPSSGSTPDKKSSDTCPAPEPSSAHLGLPDRHGQESIDRHILPAFTTIASLVL